MLGNEQRRNPKTAERREALTTCLLPLAEYVLAAAATKSAHWCSITRSVVQTILGRFSITRHRSYGIIRARIECKQEPLLWRPFAVYTMSFVVPALSCGVRRPGCRRTTTSLHIALYLSERNRQGKRYTVFATASTCTRSRTVRAWNHSYEGAILSHKTTPDMRTPRVPAESACNMGDQGGGLGLYFPRAERPSLNDDKSAVSRGSSLAVPSRYSNRTVVLVHRLEVAERGTAVNYFCYLPQESPGDVFPAETARHRTRNTMTTGARGKPLVHWTEKFSQLLLMTLVSRRIPRANRLGGIALFSNPPIPDGTASHSQALLCYEVGSSPQKAPSRFETLETVRLLVSHQGEPGSIPGQFTPDFFLMRIVPDDTPGQRVSPGISHFPHPFIPVHFIHIGSQDLDRQVYRNNPKNSRPTLSQLSTSSRSMFSPAPFTTFGVAWTPASRSMAATPSTHSRYFVATPDCVSSFPRSVTRTHVPRGLSFKGLGNVRRRSITGDGGPVARQRMQLTEDVGRRQYGGHGEAHPRTEQHPRDEVPGERSRHAKEALDGEEYEEGWPSSQPAQTEGFIGWYLNLIEVAINKSATRNHESRSAGNLRMNLCRHTVQPSSKVRDDHSDCDTRRNMALHQVQQTLGVVLRPPAVVVRLGVSTGYCGPVLAGVSTGPSHTGLDTGQGSGQAMVVLGHDGGQSWATREVCGRALSSWNIHLEFRPVMGADGDTESHSHTAGPPIEVWNVTIINSPLDEAALVTKPHTSPVCAISYCSGLPPHADGLGRTNVDTCDGRGDSRFTSVRYLEKVRDITRDTALASIVDWVVIGSLRAWCTTNRDFEPPTWAVRIEIHLDLQSISDLDWRNCFLCRSYIRSRIEFRTTMVQPGIRLVVDLFRPERVLFARVPSRIHCYQQRRIVWSERSVWWAIWRYDDPAGFNSTMSPLAKSVDSESYVVGVFPAFIFTACPYLAWSSVSRANGASTT
ncbi:hypothetical protein PR048_031731 [Dryococelus australis]|uniref:Uncharacterized protein n=1 Tax=Dryococelus australis TaxID=614101 RepID=A0ABQ9G632_9NEOP|nr:hypothetical protein PR048_031731 [Dryococelus australis]